MSSPIAVRNNESNRLVDTIYREDNHKDMQQSRWNAEKISPSVALAAAPLTFKPLNGEEITQQRRYLHNPIVFDFDDITKGSSVLKLVHFIQSLGNEIEGVVNCGEGLMHTLGSSYFSRLGVNDAARDFASIPWLHASAMVAIYLKEQQNIAPETLGEQLSSLVGFSLPVQTQGDFKWLEISCNFLAHGSPLTICLYWGLCSDDLPPIAALP